MNLDELVVSYGGHNTEAKALKKVCDTENAEIKRLMVADKLDNYTAGGYTAKYSVTKQESLNEEKALTILKEDWQKRNGDTECPYIKTREYIDMDALESVLYKGEIPSETIADLNKCRVVKEIPKLTIVVAKGE